MSLTDSVLRPLAAAALAAFVANCTEGCGGTWISPAEAYRMEVQGCVNKGIGELQACRGMDAGPEVQDECRKDADEDVRRCIHMVDLKYRNYNSNGNYPSDNP